MRQRSTSAGAAVLAAWLALAATGTAAAADKDYYFPEVRIAIAVEPGGAFTVDERRTFEFRGRFSYAFVDIPLRIERLGVRRDIAVSDLTVTDERGGALRTEITERGGTLSAKWFYEARDERRTFRIRYRVTGGVTTYADATELYWQAVGDGWDRPARNVQVTVTLPGPGVDKSALLVWGHGPFAGWAEVVDGRTARFSSPELASRQAFEIRAVWPNGLVAGVPSDRLDLAAIRAEEERYVRATVDRVRAAQAAEARRREGGEANRRAFLKAFGIWGVWQVAGPLLWLVLFFRTWSSVGKDYRFEGRPDYVRDLPSDLPPALVQILLREGRDVTPAAFTATLFDLARRGILEMDDRNVVKKGLFGSKDAVETAVTLKRDPAGVEGLRAYERSAVEYIFGEAMRAGTAPGASFTVDGLQRFLKKNPQKFQAWYRKWTKAVKAEAAPLAFLEPESLRARNRFYAFTLPVAVLTASPVLFVLSLALIPTLKRRTMDWARQNEDWKGLERFLDDFSDFEEIPAEAYKLWEHYLVFGILFGNAKKILKMLPVILQDERAAAPVWYAGLGGAGGLAAADFSSVVGGIERAATAIHNASASAAHYSSGGGGGFSGGGGGGAGGGGGGAG